MTITPPYTSALSGIPANAPAFSRSYKILSKAAECGFKWPNADSVLGKIGEELGEVGAAEREGNAAHLREEIGDALSALVTLVCFTGTDPQGILMPPPQPESGSEMSFGALQEAHQRLRNAVASGQQEEIRSALSQQLAAIVTFAQQHGVDAQAALQDTNDKFVYRFDHVGQSLHAQGRSMAGASLREMIGLWNQCKPPQSCEAAVRRQ